MRALAPIIALSLLAIALGWAYGPLLTEFAVNTWQNKPHYHHFPFVLLASAVLFARGLMTSDDRRTVVAYWAPIGATLAWLLLIPANLIPSPLFAAVSFVLLLGAAGCAIARAANRPFPLGSWALLWLVMPPPIGIDAIVIQSLQRQSSALASQALDVMGVNHLMEGNALVLPDKTLFVDEACSGIVSAVSIATCAAMYGVWRRRGAVHTVCLMALSVGWAMLLNVVRIVAITLAHVAAGWDWAEGPAHTAVGLATFALSLATLVATDWLLMALLAEVGPRWNTQTGEPIRFGQWLVNLWDRWIATSEDDLLEVYPRRLAWGRLLTGSVGVSAALVATVAFATVGGLNLARTTIVPLEINFPQADAFAAALQAEGVMPEEVGGLQLAEVEHKQRSAESLFAQHSVVFVYESTGGERYLVSCDFPYVGGWHDLSVCYRGIGWQLDSLTIDQSRSERGDAYDVAQLNLTNPEGVSALVAYCACFADGAPLRAPARTIKERLMRAFNRSDRENRHSFQTQVLIERPDGMSDADRGAARHLLEAARDRFTAVAAEIL